MTGPFQADYTEFLMVKGRKVLKITLEVPLEEMQSVLEYLGAPKPHESTWVAVALVNPSMIGVEPPTEAPPVSKAKQRYAASDEGKKAVVRAGALAKDERFYPWLIVSDKYCYDSGGSDEDWSAEYIRTYCGIASRSELATNKEALQKFLALEEEFKRDTGMTAEIR